MKLVLRKLPFSFINPLQLRNFQHLDSSPTLCNLLHLWGRLSPPSFALSQPFASSTVFSKHLRFLGRTHRLLRTVSYLHLGKFFNTHSWIFCFLLLACHATSPGAL